MGVNRTKRIRQFGLIAGAAALVLLMVGPVFGTTNPDADHLRLTDDFEGFFYGATDPIPLPGVTIQPVTPGSKGCEISPLTGPLVDLSSNSGQGIKDPGLFDHGIGVKAGGSNGVPCSETGVGEQLIIESHFSWIKLELDVQPKNDAWIHVELYDNGFRVAHHQLVTGDSIAAYNDSSGANETPAPGFPYTATTTGGNGALMSETVEACANPSDSGPDSGPNDNCRWFIQPGVSFNKVVLSTTVGRFALEGGDDFDSFDPDGFADGHYDSLFFRGVVCSEETVEDTDGKVFGAFTLLTAGELICKHYSVIADGGNNWVTFDPNPNDETNTPELFRALLSFDPVILNSGKFSLGLQYDPNFDPDSPESYFPQPIQLCVDPTFDENGLVDGFEDSLTGIPDGESWCLAGEFTKASPNGLELITVFQVIGREDPRFGFK